MKKGWTATKLIVAGSLGVLSLVLQLFGAVIAAVTGTPLTSGVIGGLIGPALIVVCLLVVGQFGSATIMYFVFGTLALPFHISGVPGFLPKVPILIIEGLISDSLYLYLKRNKLIFALVVGAISQLYVAIAVVEVGRLFNMPGVEETAKFLYSPLLIPGLIFPAAGGYLGYFIFQKIKNTAVVRRIQV